MESVETTPTPARIGYWASLKTLKQTSTAVWLFFGILGLWYCAEFWFRMAVFSSKSLDPGFPKAVVFGNSWTGIVQSLFVIVLGGLADWQGLRRSLRIIALGVIALGLVFQGVALSGEKTLWAYGIEARKSLLLPFAALLSITESQALRRYTSPQSRAQIIVLQYWAVALSTGLPMAVFAIAPNDWVVRSALPFSWLVFLAVGLGILLILRWLRDEGQYLPGVEPKARAVPARPSTPLAALVGLWADRDVRRAFVLVLVTLLVSSAAGAGEVVLLKPYQPHEGHWLDSANFGLLHAIEPGSTILLLLLLLPVIGRITMERMIGVTLLAIFVGMLVLLLPVGGSLGLWWKLLIGRCLITCGQTLLPIRLLEYGISASPLGREGGVAAILGVAWLLGTLFNRALRFVLGTSLDYVWPSTLMDTVFGYGPPEQALWLLLLIPASLGLILFFLLRRRLFEEAEWRKNPL